MEQLNLTIPILLVGLFAGLLGILVIRLGKKLATFLMVLGVLAVVGLVALALNSQAQATKQAAQAATVAAAGQAATSAAVSIIAVLLALIVVLVIALGLAVIGFLLWQNYQKQRRFQALMERVQRYRLLGAGVGASGPHYARPGLSAAQPGGNILVFGGSGTHPPAMPAFTAEEMALLMQQSQSQPDEWASLYPPDDWKVVG